MTMSLFSEIDPTTFGAYMLPEVTSVGLSNVHIIFTQREEHWKLLVWCAQSLGHVHVGIYMFPHPRALSLSYQPLSGICLSSQVVGH